MELTFFKVRVKCIASQPIRLGDPMRDYSMLFNVAGSLSKGWIGFTRYRIRARDQRDH